MSLLGRNERGTGMQKEDVEKSFGGVKHMRFSRVIVLIALSLTAVAICAAADKVLGESDFSVSHTPTSQTIKLGNLSTLVYDGLVMDKDETDRIVSLTIYTSEYQTSRGLRVGDQSGKIRELYGEPGDSGELESYRWISYNYANSDSSLKYFFYLDKTTNAVKAINLNLYPVGAPPNI